MKGQQEIEQALRWYNRAGDYARQGNMRKCWIAIRTAEDRLRRFRRITNPDPNQQWRKLT